MPIKSKLEYIYQIMSCLKNSSKYKYDNLEYLSSVKLEIPYTKYKDSKIIIIHDVDIDGLQEQMEKMLDFEREYSVISIPMLRPFDTLKPYLRFVKNGVVGLHQTCPFKIEKGLNEFKKYRLFPKCFCQHISINITNFYPYLLNMLTSPIKYAFLHPMSFGFNKMFPFSFKPLRYGNLTLIFESSEPSKKYIDIILRQCNREKGTLVFNFHPEFYFKGGNGFSKNKQAFEYLIKKIGSRK